jgi:hypothetical protein
MIEHRIFIEKMEENFQFPCKIPTIQRTPKSSRVLYLVKVVFQQSSPIEEWRRRAERGNGHPTGHCPWDCGHVKRRHWLLIAMSGLFFF